MTEYSSHVHCRHVTNSIENFFQPGKARWLVTSTKDNFLLSIDLDVMVTQSISSKHKHVDNVLALEAHCDMISILSTMHPLPVFAQLPTCTETPVFG